MVYYQIQPKLYQEYRKAQDLRESVASKYADDTKNTAKIGNLNDSVCFQRELDEILYPSVPMGTRK